MQNVKLFLFIAIVFGVGALWSMVEIEEICSVGRDVGGSCLRADYLRPSKLPMLYLGATLVNVVLWTVALFCTSATDESVESALAEVKGSCGVDFAVPRIKNDSDGVACPISFFALCFIGLSMAVLASHGRSAFFPNLVMFGLAHTFGILAYSSRSSDKS